MDHARDTRFSGRTAIVTGGSRGIGLAIAQRLVAEGARVVITGRKVDALTEAVERLGGLTCALAVSGRADDVEHQQAVIDQAMSEYGSIDMLVNNAGINPVYGRMLDIDPDAARKIFEVNDLAAVTWTQAVHKHMGDSGSILNMSSVAGLSTAPNIGFYGASKAMLMHITRELAVELAPSVRVNALAPAVIKTRFANALYENREQDVADRYPMKRLGIAEDAAAAACFLLSDEASWITGQTLILDGGGTLVSARSE